MTDREISESATINALQDARESDTSRDDGEGYRTAAEIADVTGEDVDRIGHVCEWATKRGFLLWEIFAQPPRYAYNPTGSGVKRIA